jgi:hypothetical protein
MCLITFFSFSIGEDTFDGIGQFVYENVFPCSVQLASDGFGNFGYWMFNKS